MKFTKQEKNWILYDVGNSAFTLLVSTILPIYFNYLASKGGLSEVSYMSYWGYAASIATIIVAFIGPVLGSITDVKGFKKPIFTISLFLGAIGCFLLSFSKHWFIFLVIFVIAKIGFSASLIFYDSMLADITTKDRMDMLSSSGFAFGYIGSCIPFVACLGIVLFSDKLGLSMESAMAIAFTIISLWWILMSMPLLRSYKQINCIPHEKKVVRQSFSRLGTTFKEVFRNKQIFFFLLAFFFYIDGVYTIIDMATAYGQALGLDSTGLLLALLVTQIVAFPFAIIFGRLTKKIKPSLLILLCIQAYTGIAIFAVFINSQIHFWILAIMVGIFQGGIQALSRSYYAKIIPPEKSGEYFGLMDICGKGAAFLGTTLVSIVSQLTGSINRGVSVISLLFVIGTIFFVISLRVKANSSECEVGSEYGDSPNVLLEDL